MTAKIEKLSKKLQDVLRQINSKGYQANTSIALYQVCLNIFSQANEAKRTDADHYVPQVEAILTPVLENTPLSLQILNAVDALFNKIQRTHTKKNYAVCQVLIVLYGAIDNAIKKRPERRNQKRPGCFTEGQRKLPAPIAACN